MAYELSLGLSEVQEAAVLYQGNTNRMTAVPHGILFNSTAVVSRLLLLPLPMVLLIRKSGLHLRVECWKRFSVHADGKRCQVRYHLNRVTVGSCGTAIGDIGKDGGNTRL